MVHLHQPKWRKFLSLKTGRTVLTDEPTALIPAEPVPPTGFNIKGSTITESATHPKKRKRTEEEIALRKAKKLKSKNKEGQEWKNLTEDHQNQQLSQSRLESNEEGSEDKLDEHTVVHADADSKPSAALLSMKAKEIAKARREEKLQERQKKLKKSIVENTDLEGKATQVVEYLEQYHAHVNSGSEWKFKKQHQNWIVKHLYSYPWRSDELAINYLKNVQGRARRRLIEDAKRVKDAEGVHGEDMIHMAENVLLALKE